MSEKIFIDTSGFKALLDSTDEFHTRALAFWQQAEEKNLKFVTTNYILDEIYTLLRVRAGKDKALELRDVIKQSYQVIEVIWVEPEDEILAWKFFEDLPGRGVSFTDCVSFAVMKKLGISSAFSFDKDFQKAKFNILP